MGVAPRTTYNSLRTTSASAYLSDVPSNLSIKVHSIVARVLFEGYKAVGVEVADETRFFASKEVILSAGAFDTSKSLLLSGIGPREELERHAIPKGAIIPGVGHNLKDHCLARMVALVKPGTVAQFNPIDMENWHKQWMASQTGPLGEDPALFTCTYIQLDNLEDFPEFQALNEQARRLLTQPQTVSYRRSWKPDLL
ncbi:hypothetical protein F5884DRAFT_335900 [Xylogone sp. PMI_703]|nr:hypothetical protein F5884DRAFT_335900 [Xylogone sp. PMI_703]